MSKRYICNQCKYKQDYKKRSELIRILRQQNKRMREQVIDKSKVMKDGKTVLKLDDSKIFFKPENFKECEGLRKGKQCRKCALLNTKGCYLE